MSRINDIWQRKPAGMVLGLDFSGERITSPTGHSGTLVGNATVAAGTRYLELDGTGDYLEIADAPEFSFDGSGVDKPFSLSVWVSFDAIGSSYRNLLAKGSAKEWEFRPVNGSGAGIFVLFSGGAGSVYIARTWVDTPATGTWIHYAAVYSGGETVGSLAVYKNTVRVDAFNVSAGSYVGMSDTTATVRIGESIDGRIAGARIYNRVLAVEEIAQIYNAGAARIALGGTP